MANKYEDSVFGGRSGRGTRKGVKANHPGVKLINVTNGTEIRRVKRTIAEELIRVGGWKFCPKKYKIGDKS